MNIEIPTNLSETAAAEIQAIIDRDTKEQGGAFVPKDGEKYWFLKHYERGTVDWYAWESDDIDKAYFTFGNYFPTEEAARVAAPAYFAKLEAQYAIARWLAEHQNWLATDEEKANGTVGKFMVVYDCKENYFRAGVWMFYEPAGVISFGYPRYAEQFIADCGEHLRVVHGLPKEEGK